MTSMTSEYAGKHIAKIRQIVASGSEVVLTFHGKPYAHVITPEERAELDRLRQEVAELRREAGWRQNLRQQKRGMD